MVPSSLILLLCAALPIKAALLDFRKNSCQSLNNYPLWFISPICHYNPNVLSPLPEIITRNGYPLEIYNVVINGYILTIFRMPSEGQPVVIQHGIANNPGPFIDRKQRSLGYMLHDRGYDVWIFNARGTTYSNQHVKYKSTDSKFWEFSLDNMALEDIPAMSAFVAEKTNKSGEMIYLGHSMGTSLAFMLSSEKPDQFKQWYKGAIFLAPVAYLTNNILIHSISPFATIIQTLLDLMNIKGLFARENLVHPLVVLICRLLPYLCKTVNAVLFGIEPSQFLADDFLVYFSNWPVGTGTHMLLQYLQISRAKSFQKFDYGVGKNQEIYGTLRPPVYDLGKMSVPVTLLYGHNDLLTRQKDVERLYFEIGSSYKNITAVVGNKVKYNHLDFLIAKNMETEVLPLVLNAIDTYNKMSY